MEKENGIHQDLSNEKMEVDEENVSVHTDEEGGLKVDDDIYIPPPLKSVAQVDVNGPRLMIVKIVNHNFKSYGGTQVTGPFHKVNNKTTYKFEYELFDRRVLFIIRRLH